MDNVIIKGIINEFCDEFGIIESKEEKAYEHLINYLIVNRIQPEAVESSEQITQLNVDPSGTFGIDGMAFFVNDNLITSIADLNSHKSKSNEVNFIFSQVKTSPNLDTGDISKFARAVQDFFSSTSTVPHNEIVLEKATFKDTILSRDFARNMSRNSPICTMYYAFSGKDLHDKIVYTVLRQEKENILRSAPILKDVRIIIIDSDKVISLYNESINSLEIDIIFKNRINLDNIPNVKEVYSGFLSGTEFFKLIEDEEGNMRKNIFYENVRDYLGDENPVNSEIISTITSNEGKDLFPLLNNGITIIAKFIKPISSNSFTIKDYQIVNGCQTSNVIFKNKSSISDLDNFFLPVKIIYTTNTEVMAKIIRANNKQSTVPDEAFIALDDFHKQLQEYFKHTSKGITNPIYYERRSREVSNDAELNVSKMQIVTLHALIRAFVSAYRNEPHLVYSNNPNFILSIRKDLFDISNKPATYFISTYIVYQVRLMIKNKVLPYSRYHNFIYYFAFLIRAFITKKMAPRQLNSNDNEKDKMLIIKTLEDTAQIRALINNCKKIIDQAIDEFNNKSNRSIYYAQMVAVTEFEEIVKQIARTQYNL